MAVALRKLQQGITPPTTLASVQSLWRSTTGDEIAAQATPLSERAGTVTVACSSAVWASELQLLSASLLERLNAQLSEGSQVKELRFVTRPL